MPLFAILTLFPEAVEVYARTSILGLAQEQGHVRILPVDFRDFARDRHRTVDDRPFGGGPGMVLRPEPITACVEWLEARYGAFRKIALCPSGRRFDRSVAHELAAQLAGPVAAHGNPAPQGDAAAHSNAATAVDETRLLLLCGRYEGFDARIESLLGLEKLSLGDFVLSGGELPALCVAEAVTRLLPGVLGDERSATEDSFEGDGGLDHPQYTRPRVFRGLTVPDVLLSGNHAAIRRWRAGRAADETLRLRPDLCRDEGIQNKAPLDTAPLNTEPRTPSV